MGYSKLTFEIVSKGAKPNARPQDQGSLHQQVCNDNQHHPLGRRCVQGVGGWVGGWLSPSLSQSLWVAAVWVGGCVCMCVYACVCACVCVYQQSFVSIVTLELHIGSRFS